VEGKRQKAEGKNEKLKGEEKAKGNKTKRGIGIK